MDEVKVQDLVDGLQYIAAGKFDQALMLFSEVVRLAPDNLAGHHGLGLAYWKSGRFVEAVGAFGKAMTLDPLNSEHYLMLGRVFIDAQNYKQALQCLGMGILCDKPSPLFHAFIGLGTEEVYLREGGAEVIQLAVASYIRYMKMDSELFLYVDDKTGHWVGERLGGIYMDAEMFSEAIDTYQNTLKLYPESAKLHRLLGEAFQKTGNGQKAEAAFNFAKTLEKQD